jgi:DNA-binding response OmpR family regulator
VRKGTILSIDDDENLQTVVGQYLEDDGYKVVAAHNVASALEKSNLQNFDVILIDLILPDGEGMNLIPQFRAKSQAAIIVVSGKSNTTEKIICLEMGADDYMTKPFEMRELSARIKAVLRRAAATDTPEKTQEESEKIKFLDWCLDRSQYQLFDKDKKPANLTTGEFKLLEALALAPNRALSREYLFDLTREGDYDTYDRAIDIQIARLRKKLKKDSKVIKTVRGVGYMFSAKTEAA